MTQNSLERNYIAETPRIYVASLADYNAGRLHGRWIDASQSANAISEEIATMLNASKELIAGDYAIHDYEGFGDMKLSEYEGIGDVAQLAYQITEHGLVFASLLSYFGGMSSLEQAIRYIEQAHCGEFESLTDFAEQFIDDCHSDALRDLPDLIKYHIDYEGIGRDMELSGDVFTLECEGKIHVFYAHI